MIVLLKDWNNAIVTDIALAMYVAPNTGKSVHNNRPFHGFVINNNTSNIIINFSDGTVLNCGPNEVHYLPKNSNYRIEKVVSGGCWAVNFNLLEDLNEKPFNIKFRNHEAILKCFKDATIAWKEKKNFCDAIIRKCIYDIIVKIDREKRHTYTPIKKQLLIKPAIDNIKRNFTENNLSIKDMAELCGISEVYFRRIFMDVYSITPKEYIINLRIDYAKHLLETEEFSVTEIATMCGYFEPCHFSREFKKHVGISPNEYAKTVIK